MAELPDVAESLKKAMRDKIREAALGMIKNLIYRREKILELEDNIKKKEIELNGLKRRLELSTIEEDTEFTIFMGLLETSDTQVKSDMSHPYLAQQLKIRHADTVAGRNAINSFLWCLTNYLSNKEENDKLVFNDE